MRNKSTREKHAAYMREYNSRPEPHLLKMRRDRKYRQKHLRELRAYDRMRNKLLERRAARWKYGKDMRQRRGKEVKTYHANYYAKHKKEWQQKAKKRRARFSKAEWQDIQRRYLFKHKYGITVEQFEKQLKKQKGHCALCPRRHGSVGVNGRLHVDHDHKTKKFRGLLCMHCNHAIERLESIPYWEDKARDYLRPR